MKAEGDQFSPVAVNRDKEPNGAQTTQPYLFVNTSVVKVNRFVANQQTDNQETPETSRPGWRIYGPDAAPAQTEGHECRGKMGALSQSWGRSARSLVSRFVHGTEQQQVFLWLDLLAKGKPVVPFLVKALKRETDPENRCRIISALWETHDTRVVDTLLAFLQDEHEKVRGYAACGLGWLEDQRAIPFLVEKLNDPAIRVRWFAAVALERFGPPALERLRAALRDERPLVRVGAANILGWMMNPCSVDALIATLNDDDEYVRLQATAALGWARDVRAIASLAQLIEDESEWTRYIAIQAIADIGGEEAKVCLIAALNSPLSRVQETAQQALRQLEMQGYDEPTD